MNTVLVDRRIVEELRYGYVVGSGKEGRCYLPEDSNEIVKIFHIWLGERKLYFSDRKEIQIAYPKEIWIDKESGSIVGYLMPYLGGNKISYGFLKELFLSELRQAYINIRLTILKQKNVYMNDLCLDNMLYDYKLKRINLIDTSRWYPKYNGHYDSVNEFNCQMMYALFRSMNWESFPLKEDKVIKELYSLLLLYEDYFEKKHIGKKNLEEVFIPSLFSEFLTRLEKIVSEYKGEKIEKVKDLVLK